MVAFFSWKNQWLSPPEKNRDILWYPLGIYGGLMGSNGFYPLVMTNIANWKDPPFLMDISSISMAIFNSYVTNYQRVSSGKVFLMKQTWSWNGSWGLNGLDKQLQMISLCVWKYFFVPQECNLHQFTVKGTMGVYWGAIYLKMINGDYIIVI